jgi:NAD(P)H-flavin reductase
VAQALHARSRRGGRIRACEVVMSDFPVVSRTDFSEHTFGLEIAHPQMARAAQPGQFVIVMVHEHGERIPLTLADFDAARGTITLVIQAVGKTTREMQHTCQVGSRLHALVGPMGLPSPVGRARKVVCVGGGLGVAPVFPQARAHKAAGAYVIGVLGFRSAPAVFWEDKFRACCDALARHADVDELVAIGPPLMMQACAEATRAPGIKTLVSLNPVMVDGTGMCGGCRVKVGGRIRFACVDGPDFDGHEVDFDDLLARLDRYRPSEASALARYDEACRVRGGVPLAAVTARLQQLPGP